MDSADSERRLKLQLIFEIYTISMVESEISVLYAKNRCPEFTARLYQVIFCSKSDPW